MLHQLRVGLHELERPLDLASPEDDPCQGVAGPRADEIWDERARTEQRACLDILGSGGPGLLYLYKRVCRPPGGRGGAGEGYMGASDGALSPGGSIWLTSRPVLEVLVRGAGLYEI